MPSNAPGGDTSARGAPWPCAVKLLESAPKADGGANGDDIAEPSDLAARTGHVR